MRNLEETFYHNIDGIFFRNSGAYGFPLGEAEKIAPQITKYVEASLDQRKGQHVLIKGLKRAYHIHLDDKGKITKPLSALSITYSPSPSKPAITTNPSKIFNYQPPLIEEPDAD